MIVKFTKINRRAMIPEKNSRGAAAYDLYSAENIEVPPGKTVMVGTGLKMEIPRGWKGEIYSRSGFAARGLVVANSPGKIDSDYRGEIKVLLHNNSESYMWVYIGNRIAQFEISPTYEIDWEEVDEINPTKRGSGGFGSTGI